MRICRIPIGKFSPGLSQAVKYLALSAGLLSYYAGDFSFYLYLFSVLFAAAFVRTINTRVLVVLALLACFIAIKVFLNVDFLYETIRDIRFFWGFVVYLLFFSSEHHGNRSDNAIYLSFFRSMIGLLLLLLFVELLTSNMFVVQWPNRVHDLGVAMEQGIARAYGFGGNATVTSVLIVVLCMVLYKNSIRDILVLGMATSATGALVLLVKQLARAKSLTAVLMVLAAALIVMVFSKQIADYSGFSTIEKISLDYLLLIANVKIGQINAALFVQFSWPELLVGQPFELKDLRTGDFQLLDYFVFNGLAGAILLMVIISLLANSLNIIPLLLLLVGSLHYQVIFSAPGQIIFAWLLSLDKGSVQVRNWRVR